MRDLELMNVKLDPEDRALLDACCAVEKLTKSDVMRRALRAYARKLKIEAQPAPKRRSKGAK